MKIRWVGQKHDKGCVIACIAMVLDWEYDKVVSEFHNDFDKRGVTTDFAREFINDHGYSVIEKRGHGYANIRLHNKRMMIPFAPIHIVSVQQFVDKPKHAHAFVMNHKGRIYEPADKKLTDVPYYYVRHIMGFWKD